MFDDAEWPTLQDDVETIKIRTVDLFPDEDETTRRLCPWCYEPSARQVNGLDWCDRCHAAHKYLKRRPFAEAIAERQSAGKPAGKPVIVTVDGVKIKVTP